MQRTSLLTTGEPLWHGGPLLATRIVFVSSSFFRCHIHLRHIHCGSGRWLGTCCFSSSRGLRRRALQRDDWALFREMLRGNGDIDRYISDLSRSDALKASLNWYRANVAPHLPESPPQLPPVEAPTLGIWSSNDHYLDGERMKMSGQFVKAQWRYEQIDDASHWIPLDAPDRLNQFLIEWLG